MNSRQSEIVNLLEKGEELDVRDLAERFDVSHMTIRRDLGLLEQQGLLVRTHGGGISAGKLRFLQSAFPCYAVTPQKAAIGVVRPGWASTYGPGPRPRRKCAALPASETVRAIAAFGCPAGSQTICNSLSWLCGGCPTRFNMAKADPPRTSPPNVAMMIMTSSSRLFRRDTNPSFSICQAVTRLLTQNCR